MLIFAQTFVAFLSIGDHFSNVHGLLIFACVSFSRYNFIPLVIFRNIYT